MSRVFLRHFLRLIVFCLVVLYSQESYSQADVQSLISPQFYEKIIGHLLIDNKDVNIYKKMFRALEKADFEEFDNLQNKLENNILLGTALAEKYLHPQYKSSVSELSHWLEHYNSYPQAQRIYNLAKRKASAHTEFKKPVFSDNDNHVFVEIDSFVKKQRNKFRNYINQGKTRRARLILEGKRFRNSAPNELWDDMAATLSLKYLVDNYDRLAYEWAVKASRRHNSGTATWVAGLSSWRMKNYKNAARYFERLGKSKNSDEWLVAAGGYWAHRAYEKLGNKNKSTQMLEVAAKFKHTFYGILAAQKLGRTLEYNWNYIAYFNDFNNYDYIYDLSGSPYIRRAILLLRIKQPKLAEQELRFGYPSMNEKQKEAVIFIADQHNLHSLAIYLANQNKKTEDNHFYDGVAYPLPTWLPVHGWKIDKSLILGLIRQESAFNAEAVSGAGARGLMQLMPNTAYHITKDIRIKKDKTRLFRADYNLKLGQQYISYLLDRPFIDGNLFYMIAAYNAGPGNLAKWQKSARYQNDALLFIEVIPSAQTRIYIERVMANYWIYNMRFGLDNPSLEQIALGQWPSLK